MNRPIVTLEPFLVDPETAEDAAGGREIFDEMLRRDWLRPRVKKKKLVRYAPCDIALAVDRMKIEPLFPEK